MTLQNPDTSRVSIVVAMRNEEKHISQCLAALVDQDYPHELVEILVVDGLSEDRSREIVAEWMARHPFIHLLDNPKRNTPAAFNTGITHASGDVVAIVSAHCELDSDYIRQCVYYLDKTGADNVGGLMRPEGDTYWSKLVALATTTPFGVGDSQFHYSPKEQFVDTVYMGVYRREVFDSIGLFDESLIRNQDYELNYRLRASGGTIFCTPAIKSRYHPRSSLIALWRQYFQYGFWKSRVVRLHPSSTRWRHLVSPAFVLALVVCAVLSLFHTVFLWLLLFVIGSYLLVSLTFSAYLASRNGWQYLLGLPVTFAVIHVSWGLGFWWGWIRFLADR